jgi:hypothetical protein
MKRPIWLDMVYGYRVCRLLSDRLAIMLAVANILDNLKGTR